MIRMARKDLERTISELGDKMAHRCTLEGLEKSAEQFGEEAYLSLEIVHELDSPPENTDS